MNDGQKVSHQVGNKAKLVARLLHVKGLAETEGAEDIKDQVVGPVGHVERTGPLAAIVVNVLLDEVAPAVQVGMNKGLRVTQRLVGKGIVHDPALAVVNLLGRGIPSGHGIGRSRIDPIVVRLAHVGLGIVNLLVATRRVH